MWLIKIDILIYFIQKIKFTFIPGKESTSTVYGMPFESGRYNLPQNNQPCTESGISEVLLLNDGFYNDSITKTAFEQHSKCFI